MRHCPTCKQTKEDNLFYRNRHLKDGYNQYCKSCWRQYTNARRARPDVREKTRAKDREYNNRPEIRARLDKWCEDNWATRVIHKSSSHAAQRGRKGKPGITCTITREYVIELWKSQGGRCAYTNAPMSQKLYRPDSVSLDRIDSSQGYEPGNVALCCSAINMAKRDHSAEVFREFIALVKRS